MAADFLESNLFNPTAPPEQFLKRTRRRRHKAEESEIRKHTRNKSRFQEDASDNVPSKIVVYGSQICNNNLVSRNNNNNRLFARIARNDLSGNNVNNCRSKNNKTENIFKCHLSQPLLHSVLSEGMVKLPGPPNHPLQVRSSASQLASASRRERVRRSVSQNLPVEANLLAGTREVLFQESQFEDSSFQTYSKQPLIQKHLISNQRSLTNSDGVLWRDNTSSALNQRLTCQEGTFSEGITRDQEIMGTNSPNHCGLLYVNPSVSHFNTPSYGENSCDTIPIEPEIDSITDTFENSVDLQCPHSTEKLKQTLMSSNEENILQMQTDFNKLNLTNQQNTKCTSMTDRRSGITQSLFRETLSNVPTYSTSDRETNSQEEPQAVDHEGSPNTVQPPKDSSVEDFTDNKARSKTGTKSTYAQRKQLWRFLHFLLGLRWRRNSKREEKKILVEEEITEYDGSQKDQTVKKTKHKNSKQSVKEHKSKCTKKCPLNENKDTKTPNSSTVSTKTKKRRPRKKNVYRTGRRLRKQLRHGCRYVIHGFANMSYAVPGVTYMGPRGPLQMSSPQYVLEDLPYNPCAPSWNGNRCFPVYDYN